MMEILINKKIIRQEYQVHCRTKEKDGIREARNKITQNIVNKIKIASLIDNQNQRKLRKTSLVRLREI